MRSTAAVVAAAAAAAALASSRGGGTAVEAFVPTPHHTVSSAHHHVASSQTGATATTCALASGPPSGGGNKKKKGGGKKKKKKKQTAGPSAGRRRFAQSSSPSPSLSEIAEDNVLPREASVMQTSKSIEELESIMSQRWGTSMDRWTADLDEEELAFGNDDDDDYDGDYGDGERDSFESKRHSASGNGFRAKPVLDPWQKAEAEREAKRKKEEEPAAAAPAKSKRESKRDNAAAGGGSGFFGRGGEDAVLDRVRRGQEKIKREREEAEEAAAAADAPKKGKGGKRDERRMEFYDEDDEGYEGHGDDDDDGIDIAFDTIISPEPASAGGRGRKNKSKDDEEEERGAYGGFFFRQTFETESAPPADDEEAQKRSKKDREPRRPSKRDEDGNEMFLTLDQAEKNVAEYLASLPSSDASTDIADEDDPLSINDWEDVGITDPALLDNLRRTMRCPRPLYVQDQACPPVLAGSDVLVSTHTGSGKTLAFLAPLAQRLLIDAASGQVDNGVKIVVVAPGRELASQIVSVARDLLDGTGLKVHLTIGGTPFSRCVDAIRKKKPDIIVGTPGRIAELIVGQPGTKSGRMKLNSLQTVVLDEFDALLQYEPHRDPTRAVVRAVKQRHGDSLQFVLCSATAADMMGKDLLDEILKPGFAHAQVDEGDRLVTSANDDDEGGVERTTRVSRTAIHGTIAIPDKRLKLETLRRVLHTDPTPQQVLVFVDNSRRVGIVVDKLAQMGIIAAPLHGGQGSDKNDRAEVSKALREGFVGLVVSTELAARGIDAPYLTHVINLDLPTDASHYAHRAGRCGRGGRPGVVVNIAAGPQEKKVPDKYAKALGIEINAVEPRAGKLVLLEEESSKESQT